MSPDTSTHSHLNTQISQSRIPPALITHLQNAAPDELLRAINFCITHEEEDGNFRGALDLLHCRRELLYQHGASGAELVQNAVRIQNVVLRLRRVGQPAPMTDLESLIRIRSANRRRRKHRKW